MDSDGAIVNQSSSKKYSRRRQLQMVGLAHWTTC